MTLTGSIEHEALGLVRKVIIKMTFEQRDGSSNDKKLPALQETLFHSVLKIPWRWK